MGGVGVDHTVDVEAQHAGTGHVVVPGDVVEPVHVDGGVEQLGADPVLPRFAAFVREAVAEHVRAHLEGVHVERAERVAVLLDDDHTAEQFVGARGAERGAADAGRVEGVD